MLTSAPTRIALLLAVVTIGGLATGYGQTKSKDEHESEQLARAFSRRLFRTKDVGPLFKDFFADDSLERYLENSRGIDLLFVRRDVALKAGRDQRRRYYVAQLNWWYLSELYLFSKYSPESEILDDPSFEQTLPANVWRVLIADPFISDLVKGKLSGDEEMVSSPAQLSRVTRTFEKAVALLRRHVTKFGRRPNKHYRETLADWRERFHLFQPWSSTCDEVCFGMPPKSKLVTVNVPSFQINLGRIDGRMKILIAMPLVD